MTGSTDSVIPETLLSAEAMAHWATRQHDHGHRIALVPTMGALHAGHLSLVNQARSVADRVLVSIFVNPLQFGPGEDFERYPRLLEADRDKLRGVGVDAIFAPGIDDIYPDGVENTPQISAGPRGDVFEGHYRPGHFDGVLTVVSRLFDLSQCDYAVFGAKDAQQLLIIEAMAATRYPQLTIVRGQTIRDSDGLALSSRNVYLSPEQRQSALALPRGLAEIASATDPLAEIDVVRDRLDSTPGIHCDYLDAMASGDGLAWSEASTGECVVVGAIRVGSTRLIDNVWLGPRPDQLAQ